MVARLSRDEKKLYYVVQAPYGNGPVNIDDLYEYNIQTRVRTKLMNLKGALGGGQVAAERRERRAGVFRQSSEAGVMLVG